MAFPFVFASSFDAGVSGWDSETDTGSVLSIAHYTTLAWLPHRNCAPFDGAYSMRISLNGGTDAAYFEEADINIADNTDRYFAFNIWFSPDFEATANDTFDILTLLASGTAEAVFGARYVAASDEIQLGIC